MNEGDLEEVSRAIAAGASVRYRDANGYDAMIHAVHGRDVGRDPRLLQLLKFLVDSGVELSGVTHYKESALRVLSRVGRFDAVKLLLDAGADRLHLGWTPLIEAVALGSLGEVETRIEAGASLEDVDWWERTAWLIALLVGDIAKAKLLLAAGANPNARGRWRRARAVLRDRGAPPRCRPVAAGDRSGRERNRRVRDHAADGRR